MTDLNRDGTLDVVMGAGKGETDDLEQGVLALDGSTGEVIWQVPATASVVGSPTFLDVTGDDVNDIFIGGRDGFLVAINGESGEVLWKYSPSGVQHPILKYVKYNFYTSALLPDQSGDDISELLVVNGGNWNAVPNDESEREPGVLMVIDPTTGNILTADTMPDGQESYMSPVAYQGITDDTNIIFGSGGETIGGSLYHVSLSALMKSDLQSSTVLASDPSHGYIGPPVLFDLDRDGHLEIASASHGGHIYVFNGEDLTPRWNKNFEGFEISNSFAVGHFSSDKNLDLTIVISQGTWPSYTYSHHLVLDGMTGQILYRDSSACFSLSSPIAADLNGDEFDEILLSRNRYDCAVRFSPDTLAPPVMSNELVVLDLASGRTQVIESTERFMNIFSTPWIGDMDANGYLDIIYSQYYNPTNIRRFLGMQVKRIDTAIRNPKSPTWGGYQGTDGTGIVSKENGG